MKLMSLNYLTKSIAINSNTSSYSLGMKTIMVLMMATVLCGCNNLKRLTGLDSPKEPKSKVRVTGLWDGYSLDGERLFLVLNEANGTVYGRVGGDIIKATVTLGTVSGSAINLAFEGLCPGTIISGEIKSNTFLAAVTYPCGSIDETIVLVRQ